MGAIVTELDSAYPDVASQLRDYASKINSERAADAFNFQQYIAASKKRQDLVFEEKAAEEDLKKQELLWEQAHKNFDQLTAATQRLETVRSEKAQAATDRDTYRAALESNQQNISIYRNNAEVLIASLPEKYKSDARFIIDPCVKPPGMGGGLRARPLMAGRF